MSLRAYHNISQEGGGVTATHRSTTRVPYVLCALCMCMWAGLICKHMHKEIAHTGACRDANLCQGDLPFKLSILNFEVKMSETP